MANITIIVDPNGGAMPIDVTTRREGAKEWACIRFNRMLAQDHERAESVLDRALGRHGLCGRGIVGGNHVEIITDFASTKEVYEYLQVAGVV